MCSRIPINRIFPANVIALFRLMDSVSKTMEIFLADSMYAAPKKYSL